MRKLIMNKVEKRKKDIINLLKKDRLYDHVKRNISINCCSCDYIRDNVNFCELFQDGISYDQDHNLDRLKICKEIFGE